MTRPDRETPISAADLAAARARIAEQVARAGERIRSGVPAEAAVRDANDTLRNTR